MAYNGGSVGGVVFSPLWAALIDRAGFPAAAATIGLAMVAAVMSMSACELARTLRAKVMQEGKWLRVRLDGLVKTLPGQGAGARVRFELLHELAEAGSTVWRSSASTRQSSFNAESCLSMELTC